MAGKAATPWGQAAIVDEIVVEQESGERSFVTHVQLLEVGDGERLLRLAYATGDRPSVRRGPVTLRVADLDDFKKINDRFGHGAGDEVLRAAADVFRSACRDVDLPARLGGEELAVLAPETDVGDAASLAERQRAGLEDVWVETPRGKLSVTASFGVAAAPPEASAELLLQAADSALYAAKRAGKNRVERWTAPELEISR